MRQYHWASLPAVVVDVRDPASDGAAFITGRIVSVLGGKTQARDFALVPAPGVQG